MSFLLTACNGCMGNSPGFLSWQKFQHISLAMRKSLMEHKISDLRQTLLLTKLKTFNETAP